MESTRLTLLLRHESVQTFELVSLSEQYLAWDVWVNAHLLE
jgi:hypothetical protein